MVKSQRVPIMNYFEFTGHDPTHDNLSCATEDGTAAVLSGCHLPGEWEIPLVLNLHSETLPL